jgi:hypothetical protein
MADTFGTISACVEMGSTCGGRGPGSTIGRPDLVILDRSDYGWHKISLVELTCPWDTNKAKDHKYASLKVAFCDKGWDYGLYTIEVAAWGHISKSAKDYLRSLFRA